MKNILITGSSDGIGQEIANHLEDCGYRVFRTGRRKFESGNLDGAAPLNYFSADLKDFKQLEALYKHALNFLGRIDVLINNAGEYFYCPVEKMQYEAISGMVHLNLIAPCYLASLVAGDMKKNNWGRIINIGSISGAVGEAGASLYSATKAGLIGMTRALGLELAADNITVNTINPGWVRTKMVEDACEQEILDTVPQKRFIEPLEIAKMAEYLITDGAKGVTGQMINLCAGLSVGC